MAGKQQNPRKRARPKGDALHAKIHRQRYYRYRIVKVPIAEIAREEGVKEETVRNSIELIEQYNAAVNPELMLQSASSIVMNLAPLYQAALDSVLSATVVARDERGTPIKGKFEPNYEVRTAGMRAMNELIKATSPKSPVNFNVNASASAGAVAVPTGPAPLTTYEDRIREIQRRRLEQRAIPAVAESLGEDLLSQEEPQETPEPIAVPINVQASRPTD